MRINTANLPVQIGLSAAIFAVLLAIYWFAVAKPKTDVDVADSYDATAQALSISGLLPLASDDQMLMVFAEMTNDLRKIRYPEASVGASEIGLGNVILGRVVDAKVPTDRETGRPRGFAFVEFEDEEAVQRCIEQMHGKDLKGRPLRVNEAEDRPPRPAGGSGFSRGPGPDHSRPSPGYRPLPSPDYPPDFEREDRGGGRGKRFRQKPSNRRSSRRRRDQIADDDEDY